VPRDFDPGKSGRAARPAIPARKRWGQHFLASPETAERIVQAARVGPQDTVFEVGPGDGALTRAIAARGSRLAAVEIDPLRAEELAREFSLDPRVTVIRGDVLDKSFADWLEAFGLAGPAVLLANLPYNVATPILSRAIEDPGAISRTVATVQREVARRFAARTGAEDYGYLSVRAAAFSRAKILFDLPPSAFRPRPKVVSSVLELSPRSPALDPFTRTRALLLASLGFRSRRKTLANALSAAGPRQAWAAALVGIGRGALARAEELSLEDFLELARRVPPEAPGEDAP
jgi:16S rRNA (adenine1518-N6/adenine1519-N6)-dimethyltransferase